jgi:acylphosphatase
MDKHVQITIYGKVHGVFFRASAKKKADALGILGSVKNNDDGTVIIDAFGPSDRIDQLMAWCHDGPRAARVHRVEVTSSEIPNNTYANFEIVE